MECLFFLDLPAIKYKGVVILDIAPFTFSMYKQNYFAFTEMSMKIV